MESDAARRLGGMFGDHSAKPLATMTEEELETEAARIVREAEQLLAEEDDDG